MHPTVRDFIKNYFELNCEGLAVWSKPYLKFKVGDLVKFYHDTDYKCEMLYLCLGSSTAIREVSAEAVINYLRNGRFKKRKTLNNNAAFSIKAKKCVN